MLSRVLLSASLLALSGCSLVFALFNNRGECEPGSPSFCEGDVAVVCADQDEIRVDCPNGCNEVTGECNIFCGDDFLQEDAGERCDPPGSINDEGDQCNQVCQLVPRCGNNFIDPIDERPGGREQCDDGNLINGDGCDQDCQLEFIEEVEPNDDGASDTNGFPEGNDFDANAAQGPFTKDTLIKFVTNQNGDEEVFSVTNTAASKVSVRFDVFTNDSIFGNIPQEVPFASVCESGVLNLRDANGSLLEQNIAGINEDCPGLSFELAPQQTIFVHYIEGDDTVGSAPFFQSLFIDFDAGDPFCGDGVIQPVFEECDPPSALCENCQHVPTCGDNYIDVGEFCDDGNVSDGDGCNFTCEVEGAILGAEVNQLNNPQRITEDVLVTGVGGVHPVDGGFTETDFYLIENLSTNKVEVSIDSSLVIRGLGVPCRRSVDIIHVNGVNSKGTAILFGDSVNNDGEIDVCEQLSVELEAGESAIVTVDVQQTSLDLAYFLQIDFVDIVCGNGEVSSLESCDDGNTNNNDGCDADCVIEFGFVCDDSAPSVCRPIICGDGFVDGFELCDDGDSTTGDGCAGDCRIEPGFTCSGEPSSCRVIVCGDSLVDFPESCDDGNTVNGDTCDADCEPFNFINESEPNDDGTLSVTSGPGGGDFLSANANGPFSTDVVIAASISPLGDEDIFAINNPTTGAARIRLDTFDAVTGFGASCGHFSAGGADTVLNVRSANGALLASNDERVNNVDSCSGLDFVSSVGQTVFVQVLTFNESTTINNYFLRVVVTPIICGDGVIEFPEQCDDGNLIDDDGCSASCVLENAGFDCPVNQTLLQIASTDVPKDIPDANPEGILSTINIADNRSVKRVIINVESLSHTFVGDLEISLLSPTNQEVRLFSHYGSSTDGLANMLLDDGCISDGGPISGGAPPFSGCFAPDEPLSAFNNQSANGVWKLKLADTAAVDIGTLNAWTLGLCLQ